MKTSKDEVKASKDEIKTSERQLKSNSQLRWTAQLNQVTLPLLTVLVQTTKAAILYLDLIFSYLRTLRIVALSGLDDFKGLFTVRQCKI